MSDKPSEASAPGGSARGDGSDAGGGGIRARLRTTRLDYRFTDESGYCFDVEAVLDDEWGWAASVTMVSRGLRTPESAVEYLGASARHFLRMLEDARTVAVQPAGIAPPSEPSPHAAEASEAKDPGASRLTERAP